MYYGGAMMNAGAETSRWPKATRERPCPECGHVNKCLIAPDGGAVLCWRNGGKVKQLNGHKHHTGNGARNSNGTTSRPATRKAASRYFAAREAAIEAALKSVQRENSEAELTHVWEYHAPGGALLFVVARFEWLGGKSFRPLHLDGNEWREGDPTGLLPLYRVNDLPADGPIFVTEGEKACDAALAIGLAATTSAHGSAAADKSDWTSLSGREVVILPDHDEPGRKYARTVARLLFKLNPSTKVKILELPDLPDGGDIVEFIESGGACDEVLALAKVTKPIDASEIIGGAVTVRLSDVKRRAISWLWPERIALGKLTLLFGDPGVGKSFITIYMASTISTGGAWPDGSGGAPIGTSIILNCEDEVDDTIAVRADKAGADTSKIVVLQSIRRPAEDGRMIERNFTLDDVAHLDDLLRANPDTRAVFIDPVSGYLSDTDSHKNSEVRGLLAPLAKLASDHRVAVVMVTHMSKGGGGRALYRAMGSLAFIAAARSAWLVTEDKSDPDRRLFLPAKNNIGNDRSGLAYRIVGGAVQWEAGTVEQKADEAIEDEAPDKAAGRKPTERTTAARWLWDELSDMQEHPVASIKEATASAGMSWRTIQRAADEIDVIRHRATFGSGYTWRLPRSGDDEDSPRARARAYTQPHSGTQGADVEQTTTYDVPQYPFDSGTHDESGTPTGDCGTQTEPDEYGRLEREAITQEGM
jgi:putative DNA primase/helicase